MNCIVGLAVQFLIAECGRCYLCNPKRFIYYLKEETRNERHLR
jgi:hypothetical protein